MYTIDEIEELARRAKLKSLGKTLFFLLIALAFLGVLWILVLRMLISFRSQDLLAGKLQIPYLLWLSFAALLNEQVWQLNR